MQPNISFTRFLVAAGVLLTWFPLVSPVLMGFFSLLGGSGFRFDYLMPAELFLLALAGGLLLLWASVRTGTRRVWIGGGLLLAVAMLVVGQLIASYSGLADGRIPPTGLWWALVVTSLALYVVGLLIVGIGGVLLLCDVFPLKLKPAQ